MFSQLSTLFVFATVTLAARIPRADAEYNALEAPFPSGKNFTQTCGLWNGGCYDLASRNGTAVGQCEHGFDGQDTVLVMCAAQSGSKSEDFTAQVANHLQFGIAGSGSITADGTQEVKFPSGKNFTQTCGLWNGGCYDLASRNGTALGQCEQGFDGNATAFVQCSAQTSGNKTEDFTSQVAQHLQFDSVSN